MVAEFQPEEIMAGQRLSSSARIYSDSSGRYLECMAKHLVDIDEQALEMARTELGTTALRHATSQREQRVAAALDLLAGAPPEDRAEAWR